MILLFTIVFYSCSNDSSTGPQNPTVITSATFSFIQSELFTPTCATSGCHNGFERPNLTSGNAYNNILNVQSTRTLDYIEPGNPDNSYLFRKLTGVSISGSLMPRRGSALSAPVIDSIRVWIENGALNN